MGCKPVEIVIDTTIIKEFEKSIIQNPLFNSKYSTPIDKYIKNKILKIAIDCNNGLIDEWCRTNKIEFVQAIIIKWKDDKGLVHKIVEPIPRPHGNQLRQYSLNKTIDKLLIKIALQIETKKYIISNDSEFWDPRLQPKTSGLGDPNTRNARYLRENLEIHVLLLSQLLDILA